LDIVALTDRYKRLQNKILSESKQSQPIASTASAASLESWLSDAELILTGSRNVTLDSLAQLQLAIRQHRVCGAFTWYKLASVFKSVFCCIDVTLHVTALSHCMELNAQTRLC